MGTVLTRSGLIVGVVLMAGCQAVKPTKSVLPAYEVATAVGSERLVESSASNSQITLPAPTSNWIVVPEGSHPDPDVLAMVLHPRGEGHVTVRRLEGSDKKGLSNREAVSRAKSWLKNVTQSLELPERGVSDQGVHRDEFTFRALQGSRPVAGRLGVYVVDGIGYAVVAMCNKPFFAKHRVGFDRVLAGFRVQE